MTDKLPEKYNDSCVKMFQFLQMMTEDCADYDRVIELFSGSKEGKNNPSVTLNKYLNTMKIFGLKIKKYNKKYHLLNPPVTIDLDRQEQDVVKLLNEFMEVFPSGKNKKNFLELLEKVYIFLPGGAKEILQAKISEDNSNFKYYLSEYKNLIEECENYCSDKLQLKITFKNEQGLQETVTATPQEVKYNKRKVCFSVFNTLSREICDIPVNDIIKILQLPSKSGETYLSMTVVFKLKSRLAKNYKLKPGETSKGYDAAGHLVIVNKNEDHSELLKRLLRYGTDCEVISPKAFKNKMKELIQNILCNYQDK